jgi:hypothetical protein
LCWPWRSLADDRQHRIGRAWAVLILDDVEQVGYVAALDLLERAILPTRINLHAEDALDLGLRTYVTDEEVLGHLPEAAGDGLRLGLLGVLEEPTCRGWCCG